ncbi:hypothetical protein EUGRSUZ_F03073 [Eucalyptus grandis]|uniref:Uncharacterized protein n=2 Tax=Eucalyptus grandis TaxID=71139 RepID=A0ACC3KKY0_EUCGR|nr:hypothetical protein EUGRSUZ_F03073 [Eucalyptus grandis]
MDNWGPEDDRFFSTSTSRRDEEEALQWAAIEKLPTYRRLRISILESTPESTPEEDGAANDIEQGTGMTKHKEVDVRKLNKKERHEFIEKHFKVADVDNAKFLTKLRSRLDRVGIQLPTIEVRFEQLRVEADCYVGSRALPTLLNEARNIAESALRLFGIKLAKKVKLTILKDVSGIIRPSRMTLLLGPPSSGKTTLLLALAGKLNSSLKVKGQVSYNGYRLKEFVPQKTSAYISQNDVHLGDLTVKETFDYSARFQGVGPRYDLLAELSRREKDAGVRPESDVDLFMKLLGLDVCKDTVVGDEMKRGVSGGQKKRVTTGEMMVGPTKTLLMDEISTGLDSSTTFQIVRCMQQIAHLVDSTIFMSLLQPDPETFGLFDDIVLLSEGHIIYEGPREHVVEFFESCGFRCPERKGVADFLQEVTSKKDQEQYWADMNKPYQFISVAEFSDRFKAFHVGQRLERELQTPYDKSKSHRAALTFTRQSTPKMELLKASIDREWLLIKRTRGVYIFRTFQIIIVGFVAATVFLRTRLHRTYDDAPVYIGGIIFAMVINMFNGNVELSLTLMRLPVFFKQRDFLFYPAWVFTVPNFLLRVPISVWEAAVWTLVTYYPIGYDPDAGRFFKYMLVVFLIQQMAAGLFRFLAGACRTMMIAQTGGSLALLLLLLLGGFILPKRQIPVWWSWANWVSPLSYAFKALTINEMRAPRWMNKLGPDKNTKLGEAALEVFDVNYKSYWFWIGTGALFGFIILFNILFTYALMYLNPLGNPQAVVSDEDEQSNGEVSPEIEQSNARGLATRKSSVKMSTRQNSKSTLLHGPAHRVANDTAAKRGMILPFQPLSMSFDCVNYHVDMPSEIRSQGVTENKLQLLREVTGTFRPGVLTALMGVSGAGKTTLMDVLAGRKTGGYIEGDIRISGFPKKQETFARISGYCEQTDIHSPQITIKESLIYSAFLRVPKEVDDESKMIFVDEVMELVELGSIKNAIVGLPGVSGLSTEQRKRLTIAVELVANPSIIFMDEPTSGLDARAAAIVMRTVRNTVDTGRTVVCTIHQPSIDIFEAFDELLLMKRGGQVIYSGPLGMRSCKLVEYFEAIPGVPKIREEQNPAGWMLDVSSVGNEVQLKMDFAEYYKSSALYKQNKDLVDELRTPPAGANDLYFPNQYSQSTWGQFKSCLWKQWWIYWRSPDYNLVRILFTLLVALVLGSIFWRIGKTRAEVHDLTTVIGAMYVSVLFVGINNCSTVQPIVSRERSVFYRERAAGMYAALPYAVAQVVVEIPYVLVQSALYSVIIYGMMSFQWTAAKFFWFFFITFVSLLYFTYYGMMTVALTPNLQAAAIFASAFFGFFTLFSGFFIPKPKIPIWWKWYYYICPLAWTVYALIVTQYGDMDDPIKVPGTSRHPSIKRYLEDHFGYNLHFMGPTSAILVAFAVFFALLFAICITRLNFQRR